MTRTDDEARRTAARRAAARQHHPDAGGSAAAFIAAMADIDVCGRDVMGPVLIKVTGSRRVAALRRRWRHHSRRHYITLS